MHQVTYRHLFLLIILFVFFSEGSSASGNVNKIKPYFTSAPLASIAFGSIYHYQFKAKDSLNGAVSFSVIRLPGWLTFNPANNSITGKSGKAGQYLLDIIAFNSTDTTHQRFMLTVSNKKTTNILCIGNSITNGTNKYNSYRRSLWQMLHKENFNFDFIGSWDKHHMGGDVPDPDFDMDHDGHSGWRFDDIFNPPSWDSSGGNINTWLTVYLPDIVLLELGTNDVFQCRKDSDMIADLKRIVDVLRQKNRNIKIFLAQIPPLGKQWASQKLCGDSTTYDQAIKNLNNSFVGFAKKCSERKSPVILVDQYSGINTDTEMYDDIHPNEAGEKRMAENWFKAFHLYLNKLH